MTPELVKMLSPWNGAFGRPLTDNYVLVPKTIGLNGRRLVYGGPWRLKRISLERLLDEFLRLADQFHNPPDALAFARKFGPLLLCEHHGIAAYHKPVLLNRASLGPEPIWPIDKPFKWDYCGPRIEHRKPGALSENIEVWFKLARRAASLLRVASLVRTKGDALPDQWREVDGYSGSFAERDGVYWAFLDDPWQRLAANLEWWILAADVSLQVRAEGRTILLSLAGNRHARSSFALLTLQLLLAAMRAEGLVSCAGCKTPCVSNRPPLAGKQVGPQIAQRDYCRACRDAKLPQRDAARDYRQRRRSRTLH